MVICYMCCNYVFQISYYRNIIHELYFKGHFEHDKTLALVSSCYYYPKLSSQVSSFMKRCIVCQRSKGFFFLKKNVGLYTLLSVLDDSLLNVNMDFVLGLPSTQQAMDFVFVVMDRFLKISHFISYQKIINASQIIHLHFNKVVHVLGIYRSIILDTDVKFMSNF